MRALRVRDRIDASFNPIQFHLLRILYSSTVDSCCNCLKQRISFVEFSCPAPSRATPSLESTSTTKARYYQQDAVCARDRRGLEASRTQSDGVLAIDAPLSPARPGVARLGLLKLVQRAWSVRERLDLRVLQGVDGWRLLATEMSRGPGLGRRCGGQG